MADGWDKYLDGSGQTPDTDNGWAKHLDSARRPVAGLQKPEEEVGPWRSGLASGTADIMTLGAKLADVAGFPETSKSIEEGAKSRYETAAKFKSEVPSYEDIYKSGDLLGSAKRLGQYGYETFAQSAPQMAALGVAGLGAAAALPEELAVGAGGALTALGMRLAAPLIERTTAAAIAEGVAPQVAKQMGINAAKASLGRTAAGFTGAAAADVPSFTGQNLTEQMQGGKTLQQTNLGPALAAAGPQSLLDVALGEVLPGIGHAAKGNMLVRFAKKGIEGAAIEGVSEGLQQALQVAQADPDKIWNMDQDTQKGILDAAIRGGLLGGTLGGAAGAMQKRVQPSTPTEDESPLLALPPPSPPPAGRPPSPPGPTIATPNAPTPEQPFPGRSGYVPPPPPPPPGPRPATMPGASPEQQVAEAALSPAGVTPAQMGPTPGQSGTPAAAPLTPDQITQQALSPSGAMQPTFLNAQTTPQGLGQTSAPQQQAAPAAAAPAAPAAPATPAPIVQQTQEVKAALEQAPELAKVKPDAKAKSTGDQVYADVRQQLQAEGQPLMRANAGATVMKEFYQRLATQLGTDAFSLYKRRNLQIVGSTDRTRGGDVYNQAKPDQHVPTFFSKMAVVLENAPMKEGTGQQWLNFFEKRNVKPEELMWSNLYDHLHIMGDRKLTKEQVQGEMRPYSVDVNQIGGNAAKFGDTTLGGYGAKPSSGYMETVISEPPGRLNDDEVYYENHWPGIPTPVGHVRSTNRVTDTGATTKHGEEFQSTLHQHGRKFGYRDGNFERDHQVAWDKSIAAKLALKKALRERIPQGSSDIINRHMAKIETARMFGTRDKQELAEQYGAKVLRHIEAVNKAMDDLAKVQSAVPNAPFKDTWPNLLFRHLLMDAIREGKDYVTWNTGDLSGEVQGHNNPENPNDMKRMAAHRKFMDERIVNYAKKIANTYGSKVEKVTIGHKEAAPHVPPTPKPIPPVPTYVEGHDKAWWGDEATRRHRQRQRFEEEHSHINFDDTQFEDLNETPKVNPALVAEWERLSVRAEHAHDIYLRLQGHDADMVRMENEHNDPNIAGGNLEHWRGEVSRLIAKLDYFERLHENILDRPEDAADDPHVYHIHDELNQLRADLDDAQQNFSDLMREGADQRKSNEVHAMKITPQMRDLMGNAGMELFQKSKDDIVANIRFLPDRTIVRLLKGHDASSFMHEAGHLFLEEMRRYAPQSKAIAADLAEVYKWLGHEGESRMTVDQHEKFARGFEQYLRTGKAPTKGLSAIFAQFKEWLTAIYKKAADLNVDVPENIRSVFDRMLGGETQASSAGAKSPRARVAQIQARGQEPTEFNQTRSTPTADEQKAVGVVNKIRAKANRVVARVFDPMATVPHKLELQTNRRLAFGQQGIADKIGKDAGKFYAKTTPAEQKAIYHYWTNDVSPNTVPEKYRAEAARFKNQMIDLGQQLVDRKVLAKDTFEAHKGRYVPNVYLKHLLDHKGFVSSGMRPSMAYTYSRKDLTPEAQAALGKIEHPSVVAHIALTRMARDIAMLDYFDRVAGRPEWTHPKSFVNFAGQDVSPQWLRSEADEMHQRRAPTMEKTSPEAAAAMRAEADKMRAAADTALEEQGVEDFDPKKWTQMPDTKQYGILRGSWVHKEIADDIMGATTLAKDGSALGKMIGDRNSWLSKATQYWKAAKVPWNPASQFRNFYGNTMQANLFGGVPWHRMLQTMKGALDDMRHNGEAWQQVNKFGLPHSTMAETELHRLADHLAVGIRDAGEGQEGIWRAFSQLKALGSKANAKVTDVYGLSEALFKTMVYKNATENGVSEGLLKGKRKYSPEEAAALADEAIYDYTLVQPSVRLARNTPLGMPFITWQVKTLEMLAKTAINHPSRFLPYVALGTVAPMAVASIAGLKDDDPDRLRKALSEQIRDKSGLFLLPFKNSDGRWTFADLGYFMPWQMPEDVIKAAAAGKPMDVVQAMNLFSNPIIALTTAVKTNVDPFTQRPIGDKRDPAWKQFADWGGYLWSLGMPSLFAGYGPLGMTKDKLTGTGMDRYGEPTPDWGQIAGRGFGINTYAIDPQAQRARNLLHMNAEIQQVKSRMTYELKDRSLTMEQKRRVVANYTDKIKGLQQDMVQYSRESAMTPSLRAASQHP